MRPDRSFACLLFAAALAVSPLAVAQAKKEGNEANKVADIKKASSQDTKFMGEIAQANVGEVALGKLGEEKATSEDVKQFAKHMVDDHGKMLDDGGKLARSMGVMPPTAPDRKQQASAKKLEGLSGEKFDRAYMEQMVKDHEQALKVVKQAAQKAKDPELKAMAQKAEPEIEEHLKMARDLASKSGETRKSASNAKSG